MAYLVTIGAVDIPVRKDGAQQEESEYGGSDERADAGNLRSTRSWEKKQWTVTTPPILAATADTITAACAPRPVTVTGALVGTSTPCFITVQYGPLKKWWGAEVRRVLTLKIRQV